jgi:hypothetical protein
MSDILDQDDEKILLEKLKKENKLLRSVISVIMSFIILLEIIYIFSE